MEEQQQSATNLNIVAAIDFGTCYSGYGFSCKNDVHEIILNRNWGEKMGMQMNKTPTTVLIKRDKKFDSFGHEAEAKYLELSEDDIKHYEIFRNFKMKLYHERDLTHSTIIKSETGREHNALDIFSMAIKYLKEHLLKRVKQQNGSLPDEDTIQWVLTIPAIWNEKAKHFMRKAAYEAGLIKTILSKQLLLALEPEAASVLYRKLYLNHWTDLPMETMDVSFPVGTQYIIIDAGGGTVDITTHEILDDGNMKEITCASGGNWGGNEVNKNFVELLQEVLGTSFIENFKNSHPSDWINLVNKFEIKKRQYNIHNNETISLDLPYSMFEDFNRGFFSNIERTVNKVPGLTLSKLCLRISSEKIQNLFNPVLNSITKHVKTILMNETVKNVKYIILAGGFGESEIVYEIIKQYFSEKALVISPHEAGLSIIKGAVLFGYNPSIITTRIARKTYGKTSSVTFIDGKHDPSKKCLDDSGEPRCSIFEVFVHKNEPVELHSVKVSNHVPVNRKQKEISFLFKTTDSNDIIYSDDPRLTNIGKIRFDLPPLSPDSKENRIFRMQIKFGSTEIEVAIHEKYKEDGEVKNLTIDFLID